MTKYPKKILTIKDLTFALDDTFDGDLFDALEAVVKYHKDTNNAKVDEFGENDLDCYAFVLENWPIQRLALYGAIRKLNETENKYDDMQIVLRR